MRTKILLLIFSVILNTGLCAQFSFTNMHKKINLGKEEDKFIQKKQITINYVNESNLSTEKKKILLKAVNNSKNQSDIEESINKSDLSEKEKEEALFLSIGQGIIENAKNDKLKRDFFPAKFNSEGSKKSTIFFEGDSTVTHFFQDNNIIYNPNLKNFSFNSEVVNDYIGPFRVGIGFQFNSTVKNSDSLATAEVKKDQLVSSLQNGGGNLFINVKYPFIAFGEDGDTFGLKSYFYHNSGIELSKVNEPDNDFVLTNNTGIAVGGFGKGINDKISFFFDARAAILYGNSKFNRILSVDEDFKKIMPLFNMGFGFNFSDSYTVKAEFYPAGNYIRKNFPTTISFIIVPKIKKEKEPEKE